MMHQRFLYTPVLLLLMLVMLQQNVFGQFEEGKQQTFSSPIIGSAIVATANNTVSFPTSGLPNWSIKNIIILRIDEESNIFPLSAFTAQVDITVDRKDEIGAGLHSDDYSLTVNYDPAAGAKYNTRDYIVLEQSGEVKITVKNNPVITGQSGSWSPVSLLRLENEMRVTVRNPLSNNTTTLTPTFSDATDYTDALHVAWGWATAPDNNLSQLEWAYVEDDMRPYYTESGSINTTKLFLNNSTRVDIDPDRDTFNIPLLYPGPGTLFYRVRAAQRKNDGNVITGTWSVVDTFHFEGHQTNLNWQSSTSFAENGKSKTVIQYFDGSLRNRQTVTKDNETGNTIVGETIYDLQGRPNVQILPTPTIDNAIQYFTNFNRFEGQTNNTTDPATFFDLTPDGVKCSSGPALDITTGNGKYYSRNNDWLDPDLYYSNAVTKHNYIPDAFGYAYTETRFMDDATERVSVQGGVGQDHQIGSGHETKYFYGKPNQQELDAVFGTEVGDASHYSKNMVQDANGQMSVSYVDMHGRTIATALAGESPANVDSILNTTDYPQATGLLTNQLLTTATNIIKDNSIESVNTILAPTSTDYTFTYKLDPAIFSKYGNAIGQQVCFDCKYDLEISLRPEDCNDAAPIVKRYSNLQIVPANNACGTPMGFIGEGITTPTNEISFSQTLTTGSWVVRKTLFVNDSMFAIRRDSALKVFLVQTQQHIYDSVFAAQSLVSGCGLPAGNTSACDSCNAHLGTYTQYKARYLTSIGDPAGYDTSTIHPQYTQDSLNCASACGHSTALSTLASLRSQMLADMIPFTGQYAIDPLFDPSTGFPTAFASSSEQAKYNIFTSTPTVSGKIKPFFRNPVTEAGAPYNYYTDEKVIDGNLLNPNGSTALDTIGVQDFASRFQTSWANSLIFYHPEFRKLKFAEDTIPTSYAWLDKVQFTDTYAQAQTLGYLTPASSDPYFVNNYVTNDKDSILKYISTYIPGGPNTSVTNPSMWQIANASILCAGVSDANKTSCMLATSRTGLDAAITNTADKDKVWQRFKGVYLSYRNDMLVKYVNARPNALSSTAMQNLQTEEKQLVFTTAQDMANQRDAGTWWSIAANTTTADTTGLGAAVNNYITDNNLNTDKCAAQRPFWAAQLMQCEQLTNLINKNTHGDSVSVNTVINIILDSMVMVCHNSQTALQPYGASTVNPSYTGRPQSFEQVINNVLRDNNIKTIADSNYFCNPFTIGAPKPFGKNPVLFVNYTSKIDSCNCSRFATLKLEAAGLGYASTTRTGMNQFLSANYHDTLTLTVWNGLQNCSSIFTDTCFEAMVNREYLLERGPSSNTTEYNPDLSSSPCTVYRPISLPSVVAMPAFLNCDYQQPCISCSQLTTLTTEFTNLYPTYSGVPYTSAAASDTQIQRNNLWARFLNYRTGFSMNSFDYIAAYSNCSSGSLSTYVGIGNDCGTNTSVDSLIVNAPLTQTPAVLIARREIIFQGTYESGSTAEFTTNLDSTLASCGNNGIAGTIIAGTSSYAVCAFDKPLNDITNFEPVDTLPCRQAQTQSQFIAQLLYTKVKDSLTANFDSLYLAKCLGVRSTEQFYATYRPKEYHYTLYYYDQAGNLVKTLPPAAVKPNYGASYLADVAAKRLAATDATTSNNELLATHYRYNTLNQVVKQKTPDAGISSFWYDRLGRLAISQNAKQVTANQYSYTLYDVLGRITEVGQRPNTTAMTQIISQDTTTLKTWIANNGAGTKEQITVTVYDEAYTPLQTSSVANGGFYQQNLRNRVSYTYIKNTDNTSDANYVWNAATLYSYDIHGNVDTLLQDYGSSASSLSVNGMNNAGGSASGNRWKRLVYNYDLISGKVNMVAYQPGQKDQFYHHYEYDAENRLTTVQTSKDSLFWERDATYDYYLHGPLARTVLGQNQVQGIDYAYTIQGWLKTVNSNIAGDGTHDMGQDGYYDVSAGGPAQTGDHTGVARDAYAYMLNYYAGDYTPLNNPTHNLNVFAVMPDNFPPAASSAGASLFNGNISSMLVNIPSLSSHVPYLYEYRYDQLNRIKAMDAFTITESNQNPGYGERARKMELTATDDYKERISYDPNGNIKTYLRNGTTQGGGQLTMDNLTYQYEKNSSGLATSNKLRYIHEQVADANYTTDIDNQTTNTLTQVQAENSTAISTDNYQYDLIGNLVKDTKEGISNIEWTVYGKIKTITKTDGTVINYTYDASGNRISKAVTVSSVTKSTFYVRDASGNTMSVYTSGNSAVNSGHLTQSEIHLYGSSRLGVYNTSLDAESNSAASTIFTRGNKFFELSNHLGNVLVTISDKKIPVSSNNTTINYYNADVVTANDYYPFGMQMPGRTFAQANSSYRYGFNGKENDNEVKGEGNQQDYGMRIYDPRIGKFLSVDPEQPEYPMLTPFQFASNRPIDGIDQDGLEWKPVNGADGNVVDYTWSGFNADGSAPSGTVAGGSILRDGATIYNYSSTSGGNFQMGRLSIDDGSNVRMNAIIHHGGDAVYTFDELDENGRIKDVFQSGTLGNANDASGGQIGTALNRKYSAYEYDAQPHPVEAIESDGLGLFDWVGPGEAKALFAGVAGAVIRKEVASAVIKKVVSKVEITVARRAAVRKAWKEEQALVKATGEGTRQWSDKELKQLEKNGKVKGYRGHHINNVKDHPNIKKHVGNPKNIEFVTAKEHLERHGGNFKNKTKGTLINRKTP